MYQVGTAKPDLRRLVCYGLAKRPMQAVRDRAMKIRIQPKERPDMVLPYPYFIKPKGMVGRQDFWKGKPLKLLGFSNSNQQGTMELMFADFWKKPKSAIGKYPVFAFKDKSWHTFGDPIERIEIIKK